jgi:hypothetical protein
VGAQSGELAGDLVGAADVALHLDACRLQQQPQAAAEDDRIVDNHHDSHGQRRLYTCSGGHGRADPERAAERADPAARTGPQPDLAGGGRGGVLPEGAARGRGSGSIASRCGRGGGVGRAAQPAPNVARHARGVELHLPAHVPWSSLVLDGLTRLRAQRRCGRTRRRLRAKPGGQVPTANASPAAVASTVRWTGVA